MARSRVGILAAGAALALHLGAASAQETDMQPATLAEAAQEASSPVYLPDPASQQDAEAHPLGETHADTAPALGTPPAISVPPPVAAASPAPVPPPAPFPVAAVPSVPAPSAPASNVVNVMIPSVGAEAPVGETVEYAQDEYRRRLSGCIRTQGAGCDKRVLTKLDRDYLRYDRGERALTRDELDEVAEARMLQFDGAPKVVVAKPEPTQVERVAEARRAHLAMERARKGQNEAVAAARPAQITAAKPVVEASADHAR